MKTLSQISASALCAAVMFSGVFPAPQTQAASPMPGVNSSTKYIQYYGTFPNYSTERTAYDAKIADLGQFEVIVIDANISSVTPRVVASLKAQPNVKYVLAYISIGEDAGVNPVIAGNGDGPVKRIINTTFDGAIVKSGTSSQYASFYIDQAWDAATSQYVSDGLPDVNGEFLSRFVNPNADWRWVLNEQRIGGFPALPTRTATAGLKQIVNPRDANDLDNRFKDFGCDGFFLDTVDTAGPYTVARSYPWTAPEMRNTVQFIYATYPSKYVFANRGTFFYNPILVNSTWNIRSYDYTIRPYIHAALFESYYLDSSTNPGISPYFSDNSIEYAPKITAEGGRPDGFSIFCLDYEQNRGTTLYAEAQAATSATWGWTEYLSPDASIGAVGTYILTHPLAADTAAPTWDSTGAGFVAQGGPDVPNRVGLQTLAQSANASSANLTWDMARDQSGPVRYNVYVSANSAFTGAAKYSNVAFFQPNDAWRTDAFNNACNLFQFNNLDPGTYYFRVRAEDTGGREETNTVQSSVVIGGSTLSRITNPYMSITLDGNAADWNAGGTAAIYPEDPEDAPNEAINRVDWRSVAIGHDATNFYLQANTWHSILAFDSAFTAFIDSDLKRGTGYVGGSNNFPIGAEYMLQGSNIWKYTGTGTSWSWQLMGSAAFSYTALTAEFSINRSLIGNPPAFGIFMYGDNTTINSSGTTDIYPNNALLTGGGGGYFSYYVPDAGNAVASMQVDGNLAPWSNLISFGLDPADIAAGANEKFDLLEELMAHDATNYYVALRNKSPFPALTNAGLSIYLDSDNNRNTGYNLDAAGSVGADYLIQGTSLYHYTGTGGTNWGWTFVGPVTSAISGNNAELSFTRASVGSPTLSRVRVITDNSVFGGTGVDRVPSDPARALVYRTN